MKYFIALFIILFCSYIFWVIIVSDLNTTPWKKQKETHISLSISQKDTLMAQWSWVKVPSNEEIGEYRSPASDWGLTVELCD